MQLPRAGFYPATFGELPAKQRMIPTDEWKPSPIGLEVSVESTFCHRADLPNTSRGDTVHGIVANIGTNARAPLRLRNNPWSVIAILVAPV